MDDPNVANRSRHRRDRGDQIPVSLGKGSLRIRLEAYYSLISPDNLTNRTEWLQKYDQIYEKVSTNYDLILVRDGSDYGAFMNVPRIPYTLRCHILTTFSTLLGFCDGKSVRRIT